MRNGTLLASGQLDALDVEPGKSKEIKIDLPKIMDKEEYFINFSILNKGDKFFATDGYELAWEQFQMSEDSDLLQDLDSNTEKLTVEDFRKNLTVHGENFTAKFEKNSGILESYYIGDQRLIEEGTSLDFWRAPTDNDLGLKRDVLDKGWPDLRKWKNAGFQQVTDFNF